MCPTQSVVGLSAFRVRKYSHDSQPNQLNHVWGLAWSYQASGKDTFTKTVKDFCPSLKASKLEIQAILNEFCITLSEDDNEVI
jgi:hypothetical protein